MTPADGASPAGAGVGVGPGEGAGPEAGVGPGAGVGPEAGVGPGEGAGPGEGEARALAALAAADLAFVLTRHGPVSSLQEAAAARGIDPGAIVKSLVVRRGADDYLFVLVPGGRTIAWPKLRRVLGVSRLSMPDAATAREVTGYERGTITPFGSRRALPVLADALVPGHQVSIGAGAHGVAATVDGDDLVRVLDASVADVTEAQ